MKLKPFRRTYSTHQFNKRLENMNWMCLINRVGNRKSIPILKSDPYYKMNISIPACKCFITNLLFTLSVKI